MSPLDLSVKLLSTEGQSINDPSLYRKLVGKLNFLMNTRPNISFVVQHLSQLMTDPYFPHWNAALHVLRYLKPDPNQGLFFSNSSDYNVASYCDADWAAFPNTRHFVSGFVVFLG